LRGVPGERSISYVRTLALDFDGVIADTSRETFTVSLRTWARLEPVGLLASHPLSQRDGAAPTEYPFEEDSLFRFFVEAMAMGNRAEDFGVLLAAHDRGTAIPGQTAYDAFRAELSPRWLERFHRSYYEEREALRREDPEGWVSLQRPYLHMTELLGRRGRRGRVAVLTARDRGSLLQLLEAWELDRVIPPEMIYDKETGVRKTAHLQRLCQDHGVRPEAVTFVDDKINHLVATAHLGVRGVLAGWGHNTVREHSEARRLGFPIASVETAAELLFG